MLLELADQSFLFLGGRQLGENLFFHVRGEAGFFEPVFQYLPRVAGRIVALLSILPRLRLVRSRSIRGNCRPRRCGVEPFHLLLLIPAADHIDRGG